MVLTDLRENAVPIKSLGQLMNYVKTIYMSVETGASTILQQVKIGQCFKMKYFISIILIVSNFPVNRNDKSRKSEKNTNGKCDYGMDSYNFE